MHNIEGNYIDLSEVIAIEAFSYEGFNSFIKLTSNVHLKNGQKIPLIFYPQLEIDYYILKNEFGDFEGIRYLSPEDKWVTVKKEKGASYRLEETKFFAKCEKILKAFAERIEGAKKEK